MTVEDRPGNSRVTKALVDYQTDKLLPPDARVTHRKYSSVDALFDGIMERLKWHEKVIITLYSRDDHNVKETHELYLSDWYNSAYDK